MFLSNLSLIKFGNFELGVVMKMMNYFCGMVHRRKAFSLISSRDHWSSPSRISDTPRAGFEPAQKWSCAVVIITTPRRHECWLLMSFPYLVCKLMVFKSQIILSHLLPWMKVLSVQTTRYIPKCWEISVKRKLDLNFIRVIKNSSFDERFVHMWVKSFQNVFADNLLFHTQYNESEKMLTLSVICDVISFFVTSNVKKSEKLLKIVNSEKTIFISSERLEEFQWNF